MKKKESRRKFINYLGMIFAFPFLFIVYLFFNQDLTIYKKNNSFVIDLPVSDGFYLFGEYFVNIKDGQVEVILNRCTHLGCKLLEKSDDKLICPCHGSKFTKTGIVLNGPAEKNLYKPDFLLDRKHKKLTIYGKI